MHRESRRLSGRSALLSALLVARPRDRVVAARRLSAHVALLALALWGCGTEVVVWDTLQLHIRSEAPEGGPITRLDIAVIGVDAAGATLFRVPKDANDSAYQVALPATIDLVNRAYRVNVQVGQQPAARVQLRLRGLDDGLKVLTAYAGVVDNPSKAREITVTLKRPAAACDADGDGVPDCGKDGCCSPGAASDCDDAARGASPFEVEDPCTECGNKVDEDCDGADAACVDGDTDGVPDCQELACGPSAGADPAVFPGATELCDSKDNDCDGVTDEDLPYVGFGGATGSLAKGAACGTGACAGGTVVCGSDGKSLACSTADKKAAEEICDNQLDDDCNGKVNDGCALTDIDGDGVANEAEDTACKHPYARFHSEIHPGNTAAEACCLVFTKKILAANPAWQAGDDIPPAAAASDAELAACDNNCDGKVTPCAPKDSDGDGVPAPLDCDDNDPLTHPNAPEKCGDGKVQACIGADPACDAATDKDGDGWSAPADCDDDPKTGKGRYPGASELCNGLDDDCDGYVDDGNAEAADQSCGDQDGECGKKPGISVCKHWPKEQEPTALDCLVKAMDPTSRTCVGCEGDGRPTTDVCDYLDNDCDGSSDEDYSYSEQGTNAKLAVGADCDGIGACGKGKVECALSKDKTHCSTDPPGSKAEAKPEVCDNKDNNCNGVSDESLTSIADADCHKAGVCAGTAVASILTVCIAGKWVCDYTKVPGVEFNSGGSCQPGDAFCHCPGLGDGGKKCFPMVESSCEGKDNDCDGKTDDDFAFDDLGAQRLVGDTCGTGACAAGKTVCKADASALTCDSLVKISKEVCDAKDNDCNGKTDDAMTVTDSSCALVGQCSPSNVKASCEGGKWVCDYSGVPAYQALKEASCDGKDNDCDGKVDEDFSFDDLGVVRGVGQGCGNGVCAGGNVVCTADAKTLTCSTLVKTAKDICDSLDNDCDGKTDEDFSYLGVAILAACDGVGACGAGKVECTPGKTDAATCTTNPDGSAKQSSTEQCDDADNDCDGATDEGCDDDKDGYCDAAITTPAKPKSCPQGGGDCKDDDLAFHPGMAEMCDGKDQDCDSKTDEDFAWDEVNEATGKTTSLGVGAPCGLGVCGGGTVACVDGKTAQCSSAGNKATEVCDGKDNDCDGLTDEGCNDDNDAFCDTAMTTVGKPALCPQGGGDCDDLVATSYPGAIETCNNVDDDCNGTTDDDCDRDGDGFCDQGKITTGKPKACPSGGGDCNDTPVSGKAVFPGAVETCNDIDDNCKNGVDEGCDDDKDGYCDKAMTTVGKPKVCAQGGGDCNDTVNTVYPSAKEVCNDVDEDCNGTTDDDCDKDNDGWCDEGKLTVNKPKACPNGGGDCDDSKAGASIHPTASEVCNGLDDDCDSKTDAADAGDLEKTAPACENQAGVCKDLKKNAALCDKGAWKPCDSAYYVAKVPAYEATVEKSCDDQDNNCSGTADEGCDDDGDGYCDAAMTTAKDFKPKACVKGGGDCNDTADSKGPKINPGVQETCLTPEDDNCSGDNNDAGAIACTDYHYDADKDGWGNPNKEKFCLCKANGAYSATKVGDCNDNSGDASTYSWVDPATAKAIDLGGACGSGQCLGGQVKCFGTIAACSTGGNGTTELCDGKDNDCDGKTDAADDSLQLKKEDCAAKGVCVAATPKLTCAAAKTACDYTGATDYQNVEATCDGKDNDCDGSTDETVDFGSFTCQTKGICLVSDVQPQCKGGAPACDYSKVIGWQATENLCDGKDNDCDGQTDENADLSAVTCKSKGLCEGKTIPKACSSGKVTCSYSGVSGYEDDETKCNNLDDDCDGQTDEVTDVTKSDCKLVGVCNASNVEASCKVGKWMCEYKNVGNYEQVEVTKDDNKDNDCDGKTDQ